VSILGGNGKNLKFKTSELLEILKKNRTAHEQTYKEAKKAYDRLRKVCDDFKKKVTRDYKAEAYVSLNEPKSYLKSYDQVIRMFELTVETEIELDSESFLHYVMDEWEWSSRCRGDPMTYLSAQNASPHVKKAYAALKGRGKK
jgi:hypothetical protein